MGRPIGADAALLRDIHAVSQQVGHHLQAGDHIGGEGAVERGAERPLSVLGEAVAIGDDHPDLRGGEPCNRLLLRRDAVEHPGEQRNVRQRVGAAGERIERRELRGEENGFARSRQPHDVGERAAVRVCVTPAGLQRASRSGDDDRVGPSILDREREARGGQEREPAGSQQDGGA